ncbi:MAG: hypothetical protein DWI58_09040 [Chloroflexi bacterium]|nr:MAG: hypothetical protein DWI58_09040 [Chloroflexota bacterium]
MFVVGGAALALAALIGVPSVLAGVGVFAGLSVVWLFGYSWWEWRADPDRVPVMGTRPASEDR